MHGVRKLDHIGSVFLRQILRRMKELGLNQSALAKRMNVSRPYIAKVLSGDVSFTFHTATKLARALQMDFFPELRKPAEEETEATSDFQSSVEQLTLEL